MQLQRYTDSIMYHSGFIDHSDYQVQKINVIY